MKNKNFINLKKINIALTQKCNKSCSYCYEQHSKTHGKFTVEKLIKVYQFLKKESNEPDKYFQFFGGEPLLESKLILAFLRDYEDEIRANPDIHICMVTNGLLLSDEIIKEFAKYPTMLFVVSLDTHLPDPAYRNSTKQEINYVLGQVEKAQAAGLEITMRSTITQDAVEHLGDYIDIIVSKKIPQMIIHPLTLSSSDGFIEWSEDKWKILEKTIKTKIEEYPNFKIHFSEGVEKREKAASCMTGDSTITIDGEGDFTGCYFFTSLKEQFKDDTTLGNIFTGEIYEEKYKLFRDELANHHSTDPKCITCDLRGYCYQCPAGNIASTSDGKFRSDNMCQKIVKLFLELQRDEAEKKLKDKIRKIEKAIEENGDNFIAKSFFQLAHKKHFGYYFNPKELENIDMPHYENIINYYFINGNQDYSISNLENVKKDRTTSLNDFMSFLQIEDYYSQNMAENLALIELVLGYS